jgi:hypothetical protein
LLFDAAHLAGLLKDDGPGEYGENQQNPKDDARHPARLLDQRFEPAGK